MTARRTDEAYRLHTAELFFDLCFVAAVAQAASHLHRDLSGGHLGHAVGNYPGCSSRSGGPGNFTWFASAYDNDDDPYPPAYPAFEVGDYLVITLGYVILRLAMVMQWLRAASTRRADAAFVPGRGDASWESSRGSSSACSPAPSPRS